MQERSEKERNVNIFYVNVFVTFWHFFASKFGSVLKTPYLCTVIRQKQNYLTIKIYRK